jgi:hypothetical protein
VDTNVTRALVHELYDAYARGDSERVAQLIDDDIDWIIHGPVQVFPFLGPRRGKAEVLKTLADIADGYAIERYEPEIVIVDEDVPRFCRMSLCASARPIACSAFASPISCVSARASWSSSASSPTRSMSWSRRWDAGWWCSLSRLPLLLGSGHDRRQVVVAVDFLLSTPLAAGEKERRSSKHDKPTQQGAQISIGSFVRHKGTPLVASSG